MSRKSRLLPKQKYALIWPHGPHRKRGFTVAELLAAVAIIGVLVAVSIPVFTSRTAKAKSAADMANIRAAKAAALAAYISDGISTEKTYYYDAAGGKVKDSQDGIAGYGKSAAAVDGASGIPCGNGKARMVAVKVKADGSCTASWGSETDEFLALAQEIEDAYTGPYHSGNDLINDVIKKYGGLLQVNVEDIFSGVKYIPPKTLFWRPMKVTVNGEPTVILYANKSPSGGAGWKGYAIYYNGTIYRSTAVHPNKKDINEIVINSDTVTAAINGMGNWEKVE